MLILERYGFGTLQVMEASITRFMTTSEITKTMAREIGKYGLTALREGHINEQR